MGLLQETDYASVNFGDDPTKVDYKRIFYARRPILEIAVKHFLADKKRQDEFKNFEKNNRTWLEDYAEFMAIKEHFGNKALQEWEDKLVVARKPKTLAKYRTMLKEQIQVSSKAFPPACKELMWIGLVSYIKNQYILRGIEHIVQGNG